MSEEFHLETGNLPVTQRLVNKPTQAREVVHRRKDAGKSPSQRCLTPLDLPDWVKRALTYKVWIGCSWEGVGTAFDRPAHYAQRYARTPGGREWLAIIKAESAKFADDPQAWVKLAAAREAPFWFARGYVHYLAADKAGDRAEAGKMIRHMQEVTGVKQPVQNAATPTVFNVTIQGQSFTVEAPTGSSTYQAVMPVEIIENG